MFFIKIGLPSRHWWPTGTEAGEGLDALSAMGVAGFIQPVRVLVQVPEGRSAVDAASLRGLMTLSDSLRADPRVREVRSLVDLQAKGSLLGYSVLYSDLPAARARYPGLPRRLSEHRPAAHPAGRDPRRHHLAHHAPPTWCSAPGSWRKSRAARHQGR